ncbi:MAG: asparagine synthase (glutamine-hydrolyzing) [Myxococcota bacterium]
MCGLTGFFQSGCAATPAEQLEQARAMADTIVHRGPDDGGEWGEPEAGYAVAFRRLAIIDLSAAGHQPMTSHSGRYVIAFNGEVYNFEAIRKQLQAEGHAPTYRGHSDTEVMLAAIEAWGLRKAVQSFVGMFAFALWDREERSLHLVRDRLGVKPMYYGVANGVLLFGSELKALRKHPAFSPALDRGALALFLRHCYVPAPYSIYSQYRKLPPGCILSVRDSHEVLPAPEPYWSPFEVAQRGLADPLVGSDVELTDALDALLRDAISLRMVADVPIGVFLSGGIDSSVVAGIMQSVSSRPIRTFSIGFEESSYNEAPHAKVVATHLRTDHTELYVSPRETLDVIPKLPTLYDEPFADSSQIPTYLVSAMARRLVTVCLTGDGGDELFAGYNRYAYCEQIWRVLSRLPTPARRAAARGLSSVPRELWDSGLTHLRPLLPRMLRFEHPADKIEKLTGILTLDDLNAVYLALVSSWRVPARVVVGGSEPPTALSNGDGVSISNPTLRMMYLDLVTYLPDDILAKVDRASMGVSLEAREPLIDHRLVEFAWRLPFEVKARGGVGKWILRRVLDRYVPPALLDRPKMGFGVPVAKWLKGPLRGWAEELLSTRRLKSGGFLAPEPIQERWQEHLSGGVNASSELWPVLMFQAWLAENPGAA